MSVQLTVGSWTFWLHSFGEHDDNWFLKVPSYQVTKLPNYLIRFRMQRSTECTLGEKKAQRAAWRTNRKINLAVKCPCKQCAIRTSIQSLWAFNFGRSLRLFSSTDGHGEKRRTNIVSLKCLSLVRKQQKWLEIAAGNQCDQIYENCVWKANKSTAEIFVESRGQPQ